MEDILNQLIGSLSQYLQGVIHVRFLGGEQPYLVVINHLSTGMILQVC